MFDVFIGVMCVVVYGYRDRSIDCYFFKKMYVYVFVIDGLCYISVI